MSNTPGITALILAGGKSKRMGRDKGLIPFKGMPMINHLILELKKINPESILIISNNPEYKQFGLPVREDIIINKGPLGGIYTGLHHSKTPNNIVCSCDTPFLKADLFKYLLTHHSEGKITIPRYKEKAQPLAGIYPKSVKEGIKKLIQEEKLGLIKAIEKFEANLIDIPSDASFASEQLFVNINDPVQLSRYMKS